MQNHIHFLIITALEEELKALFSKLPEVKKVPPKTNDTNLYYFSKLPCIFSDNTKGEYNLILFTLLDMGESQAGIATANALKTWTPDYIIFVGIAGGISKNNVKLGDVLVPNKIIGYENQKIKEGAISIRYDLFNTSAQLVNACKGLQIENIDQLLKVKRPVKGKPQRHTGPLFSGDKKYANAKALEPYLDDWEKAIGVEMEALGAAMATYHASKSDGFLTIRGVSDLADNEVSTPRIERWRPYACEVAAAYTVFLLQSGPVAIHNESSISHQFRPLDQLDFQDYPWTPFYSFRYLECLDSARFNELSNEPEIKMVNGKSDLLESLLFGDGIALSEAQLFDSRGAIDALGDLIEAAKDSNIKIPIRFSSRNPEMDLFTQFANNVGKIDENQTDRRYVISANPALDKNYSRRKEWQRNIELGEEGLKKILEKCSMSEFEFTQKWFTTIKYISDNPRLIYAAKNEPARFSRELKQILQLTTSDFEDMSTQTRDINNPEILLPQWIQKEEIDIATKLISRLKLITEKIEKNNGVFPSTRSVFYPEIELLMCGQPEMSEGIKEIIDSIYNHVIGLVVQANSLSDSSNGNYNYAAVRVGHALSQWARYMEAQPNGDYSYELPWGWGGQSQLTWANSINRSMINKVSAEVPWKAVLNAMKEPKWKSSLINYRDAVGILQVIDRNAILSNSMDKAWRQKHLDASKVLKQAWHTHIENSSTLISNEVWKINTDGIQFFSNEDNKQPLKMIHHYRTLGTTSDFSTEMQSFQTDIVQRIRFDKCIEGMVSQIAQKRQH